MTERCPIRSVTRRRIASSTQAYYQRRSARQVLIVSGEHMTTYRAKYRQSATKIQHCLCIPCSEYYPYFGVECIPYASCHCHRSSDTFGVRKPKTKYST